MINDRIETLLLSNLIHRETFSRRVLPFLKPEYFEEITERSLYVSISEFIHQYNALPTTEALAIELSVKASLTQEQHALCLAYLNAIEYDGDHPVDESWLINSTQEWCRDRALFVALSTCIEIVNDEKKGISKGSIPKLLSDALSVDFNPQVGHNYLSDYNARYDAYHRKEQKISTDLEYLNKITDGGWSRGTLNVFMSGPGGGKSLCMCHLASASLLQGTNVLYITLEMSEAAIAERIDANLMDVAISNIRGIPRDSFSKRVHRIREKTQGDLFIKQYPTASASCNNFRALLEELKVKQKFVPQIIFLDYLNIATSCRVLAGGKGGSYDYVKSIAEEVRGLAIEFNVPIVTATQVNRSGFNKSDVDLDNVSESFGVPAISDFMAAIVTNETLDQLNQLMIKQLKNRYTDISRCRKFVIGVDRPKMRLFDLSEEEQMASEELAPKKKEKEKTEDDTPAFDKGAFGRGMRSERNSKFKKSKYEGIEI